VNIKRFRVWCERGQALAEYMPTMAGAMALSAVIWLSASGGVKGAYCKAVDAFTDLPEACADQGLSGSGGEENGGGGDNEVPPEPQVEPSCGITLSSASGTDPSNWNTEWKGDDDVLTVDVSDLTGDVAWTLKLRFPTDPSIPEEVINSGVFTQNGTYHLTVPYPPKGEWGEVSDDGYGTYESHATLNISKPCNDVGWDRWYKSPWEADVAIDVSNPTRNGSTYSYTTTVTNNGPRGTEVYGGQGVTINTRIPPTTCTHITKVETTQGVCETQESCNCGSHVICDFGALGNGQSAAMTVYFTKTSDCSLFAETKLTNNSPRPPDPNRRNNSDASYVQP
jgi:hypothetical protein